MIEKHPGIEIAEDILIRLNLSYKFKQDIIVECFDNCREQGYCLLIWEENEEKYRYIAFSNEAHGDSIIVYDYNKAGVSNLPADGARINSMTFAPDKLGDVVTYIAGLIERK